MPPAGRFLKKAPQKRSDWIPFLPLSPNGAERQKGDADSLNRMQSENQRLRMNQNRHQRLFVKLFKCLAPDRAAGGDFELNSYLSRWFLPKWLRHWKHSD